MSMNNNPNPNRNQDVAPQRTNMIPIVIALVIALAIGVIGYTYFFAGDSSTTKPINKSEDNSLTAPTSNYPYDKNERQDANERNLSSPTTPNLDKNNKPFEGNDINKSSSSQTKTN